MRCVTCGADESPADDDGWRYLWRGGGTYEAWFCSDACYALHRQRGYTAAGQERE